MNAELELEVEKPGQVASSLQPSLEEGFEAEATGKGIEAEIEAKTLGRLRGKLDAAMRLTMLGEKIVSR